MTDDSLNSDSTGRSEDLPFPYTIVAMTGRFTGQQLGRTRTFTLRELQTLFSGSVIEGSPYTVEQTAALLGISTRQAHYLRQHARQLREAAFADAHDKRAHNRTLARDILLACQGNPRKGGATLARLQDRFVNRDEYKGETERDYDRRIKREEQRIASLVRELVKRGKLKELRSAHDVGYWAPQVTIPPKDPEAAEAALSRYLYHNLAIASANHEAYVWAERDSQVKDAGTYYLTLHLSDDPASHTVHADITDIVYNVVKEVAQKDEVYQQEKPPNAPSVCTLRVAIALSVTKE